VKNQSSRMERGEGTFSRFKWKNGEFSKKVRKIGNRGRGNSTTCTTSKHQGSYLDFIKKNTSKAGGKKRKKRKNPAPLSLPLPDRLILDQSLANREQRYFGLGRGSEKSATKFFRRGQDTVRYRSGKPPEREPPAPQRVVRRRESAEHLPQKSSPIKRGGRLSPHCSGQLELPSTISLVRRGTGRLAWV